MKEKILIVDDQAGIRRLLAEALAMENYLIETANDGAEAIAKILTYKPDLVLIDMKMPGLSGLETLIKLSENNLQVRAIMMTAYGELEIIEQAKKYGAVGHITKPFDLAELSQVVGQVFQKP